MRRTTIAFAAARIAYGAGLLVAPGRMAGAWLGEDARRPPTQIAVRGLGVRDIALVGGAAVAAQRGAPVRPWLAACIACDLADIASTLAADGALSSRARWGTVALAGSAAAMGAALTARADA